MSKVMGVRLDKETLNLLEEKASKEGKSKSKILKELIVNYLAESGSKPSQNDTKVNGFVKEKPVNTAVAVVKAMLKPSKMAWRIYQNHKNTMKMTRSAMWLTLVLRGNQSQVMLTVSLTIPPKPNPL
jgi:metal-responsive CopG/Arc/MetJ family transcriptional regulator